MSGIDWTPAIVKRHTPAVLPSRTTIQGTHVRLEPLDAAAHGEALCDAVSGPHNATLWQYLGDGPYERDECLEAIRRKSELDDPLFFAIIDEHRRRAAGYASLMRIEPAHRVIEIGHVLFSSSFQRTTAATEVIYLFARHVFESLGYRRFEWKCDALNEPSRRAAIRFGFTYEGTFRQHMIIKGRNRDTAWFSMIDSEWPDRKRKFERWLDPSNFDDRGQQRHPLGE